MMSTRHLRRATRHTCEWSSSWAFVQKSLSFGADCKRRERPLLRSLSRGSPEAVLRCRCKVILALVQGKSPTTIAAGGLCSASQVYRVADRFIAQGLAGLADSARTTARTRSRSSTSTSCCTSWPDPPGDHGYAEADVDPGTARPGARGADRGQGEHDYGEPAPEAARGAARPPQADRRLPLAEGPPAAAAGVDSGG